MNKCIFIGNLTKNPELSTLEKGTKCCKFVLAVKREYLPKKNESDTDFFFITTWGKTAENCAAYLKKGSKVAIVGSIQNRYYEDSSGNKKNIVEITASNVEFLSAVNTTTENNSNEDLPYKEIPVDDLPF